jgi:hypothetical protein
LSLFTELDAAARRGAERWVGKAHSHAAGSARMETFDANLPIKLPLAFSGGKIRKAWG